MAKMTFLKSAGSSLFTALWFALASPTFAKTSPSFEFLKEIKTQAQSAGLNAGETRQLLDEVQQLAAKDVPAESLIEIVKKSLSMGKDLAVEKALKRLSLLISGGLAPADAGRVSLREIQAETTAQDMEMEKSLEAGLEKVPKDANKSNLVNTGEEAEEKLEQKRQDWEERMEKEKEIQSIQNQALGRSHSL